MVHFFFVFICLISLRLKFWLFYELLVFVLQTNTQIYSNFCKFFSSILKVFLFWYYKQTPKMILIFASFFQVF